jgi:TPP-dependent pyruvate/acetoin dehydrogenase alpha subunit
MLRSWTDRDEAEHDRVARAQVDAAVAAAEKEPRPAHDSLFDDVYARAPWHLAEERSR